MIETPPNKKLVSLSVNIACLSTVGGGGGLAIGMTKEQKPQFLYQSCNKIMVSGGTNEFLALTFYP